MQESNDKTNLTPTEKWTKDADMEHEGKPQRQKHEAISYRGGRILITTHKLTDSPFWTARGNVVAVDRHGNQIFHNVTGSVNKFAKEEDAKNELIELGKLWINSQLG
jgi:hypothetical protein